MARPQPFLSRYPGIASILRNGSLVAGTQWTEAILRGIYVLVISRWLGPELYGAWSYATTSYAFAVGLTLFGLETLVPLRLGRDKNATAFLGTSFLVRLALLGLVAVAFAINALAFEGEAQTRTAMLLVLPALIGRGVVYWTRSALLGFDKSRLAFRFALRLRLFEVAAGLAALWLGAGLGALLAIHALSWLAEAALTYRAVTGAAPVPLRLDRAELARVLADGFVLGLVTIATAFLTAMPLIFLRHLTGDLATVGQIGVAMQLAALAIMGAQGLLGAALPVVARASTRGDGRLPFYGALVGLGTVAVFGPAILLAWIWGPALIPALLGAGFTPAGRLLAPALVVGALIVLPGGAWQVLVAEGRRWPGVIAGAAASLALVILLPGMIRASGAAGALHAASLAWALNAAILFGWSLVPARRR
ncbi:MAG: hypothetical protein KDK10_12180 [Maritimibacter sp.]|nr:hypothetical protein [Maritimibacter sp.]